MKWKHAESVSVHKLGDYLITRQLPATARIIFYDRDYPNIVGFATIDNIGEVDSQFPLSKDRIFRIYIPDLPKSNTEK